jgi:uncharacterized protein YecE (DUF72 family)
MPGALYLGTSGFAYKEWKGDFYPADLRDAAMLSYYATQLPSVEVNYTFQRTATEKTIARWIAGTPDGFRFSLKAHRRITHVRRLADAGEPLSTFLGSIEGLGPRVGAVLFQCPPTLRADVPLLEAFLAQLPLDRRFAFEFRHASWNDDAVRAALASRGAAWCVADTDDADAQLERTAPGFVYVRLRKTVYEDEALSRWSKAIGEALDDGADVYCYVKHEDEGRCADYARALASLRQEVTG